MSILDLVTRYNIFQQKVGHFEDGIFEQEIPLLFAENFRKIANGAILVDGRIHLKKQLEDIRNMAGIWNIELKNQLLCTDKQYCVIRYHLISKNLGIFDVMAILKCHNNTLLEEVDEVYYQVNS